MNQNNNAATNVSANGEPSQAPEPQKIVRRIYAQHRTYGTCITVGAFVYIAPEGAAAAKLDKRSNVKARFTVLGEGADAVVRDEDGVQYIFAGENGGCGPRLSALKNESKRAALKSVWHSLSFAQRITIIKENAVPAAQ